MCVYCKILMLHLIISNVFKEQTATNRKQHSPPPPIFNYIILIKYFALGSGEYALLTPP